MQYLMTASLYNSWLYFLSSEDETRRAEFLATLRREKKPPTEAMQKGINFENSVKAYTESKTTYEHIFLDGVRETREICKIAQELGDIVKGGIWQEKVMGNIKVGNYEVFLFGYADVDKEDIIYDIKRQSTYAENKYFESIQHLIYLFCTQRPRFRYLCAYGAAEEPQDWAAEDYYNTPRVETLLKSRIMGFYSWLEETGLMPIYKQYWQTKGE